MAEQNDKMKIINAILFCNLVNYFKITYFNPNSTSGSDGYVNFKMSGGDNGGGGGSGPGCGFWVIVIVVIVLYVMGRLA